MGLWEILLAMIAVDRTHSLATMSMSMSMSMSFDEHEKLNGMVNAHAHTWQPHPSSNPVQYSSPLHCSIPEIQSTEFIYPNFIVYTGQKRAFRNIEFVNEW